MPGYPTARSSSMLARTFGCVAWCGTGPSPNGTELIPRRGEGLVLRRVRRALTVMKKDPDLAFLRGVVGPAAAGAAAPAQGVPGVFREAARYPRFKSRDSRQSATYTRSAFRMKTGAVAGEERRAAGVCVVVAGRGPAALDPATVTVSRDPCGRWYVSLAVEVADPEQPRDGRCRGRGPGHQGFRGDLRRGEDREPAEAGPPGTGLARYQRRLARCQSGSANRARPRRRSPARTGRSARPAPISCTALGPAWSATMT